MTRTSDPPGLDAGTTELPMPATVPHAAGFRPPFSITISARTLLAILALVVLVWLAFRLTDFLTVVAFGALLATAISQPVTWLRERGVPRALGILVLYLVLIGLLVVVVVVLVPLIGTEITALRAGLPNYVAQLEQLAHQINPGAPAQVSFHDLGQEVEANLSSYAGEITNIGLKASRTIVLIFAIFVVAFFLAADPGFIGSALRVMPAAWSARVGPILEEVRRRVGAWARGQLVIALLFGCLMGIGLKLLGVPYAASLGVVAGVLEVFPYVGGFVTLVLAGMMALTVSVPHLIGVIVLYTVLVFVESHVLSPLLFGRAVGLPPVAILLALLAGVELLGVAGALVAVPVLVILWVIFRALVPAANTPPEQPASTVTVRSGEAGSAGPFSG